MVCGISSWTPFSSWQTILFVIWASACDYQPPPQPSTGIPLPERRRVLSWYVMSSSLWQEMLSEGRNCSVSVGSCGAGQNGQGSQRHTLWVLSYSLWLGQRGGRVVSGMR